MQTNLATERLESLKAGIVGKLTAAVVYVPIVLLNQQFGGDSSWRSLLQIDRLPIEQFIPPLVSLAIVLLSGFLFGVTYRYVVRQDENPQLQSGAVLAFGLVRGLAQVEGQLADLLPNLLAQDLDKKMPLWIGGLEVIESIVLFGAIALLLNWTFDRGWVQRMK
ncbi:hypothetical protein [Leptolyngbya ohadii]|uniref:hypothetical protein n=1 Tax=Leptolyngbya ohadii TaxID=1962290 RepID=UPI000B59B49B|nr:hypothetical protein [Leptolyngbya ohadii]